MNRSSRLPVTEKIAGSIPVGPALLILGKLWQTRVMLDMDEDYLRSALFGLQDGLVSTTGVVVGISTGVEDKAIIILASLVTVAVEASSMAAGQYSSEKAVHQLRKDKHKDSLLMGALIMFLSYSLAGLVPVVPILIFNLGEAKILSMILAFSSLFAIGFIKGKIVDEKPLRSALELFVIGGFATLIGVIVGQALKV